MANPLDPVLTSYKTLRDAIDVTRHVVETGIVAPITASHVFHTQTEAERVVTLDLALVELNQLGVLSLVAVFERTLRDHLAALPVVAPVMGDPLHDTVRAEILKDMEMWNISSRVIDLFAGVDPAIRGQVKQIIKYRNWVAHGRTLIEPPPIVILPPATHQRLTDFLAQAGVVFA